MKTMTKRLLVLAVALLVIPGMILVFQLQANADAEPNWTELNASFDPTTATTCPFCEGTVTWTALTNSAKPTSGAAHYYVPSTSTKSSPTDFGSIGGQGEGVSMCLYLGNSADSYRAKARVVARAGCTVNIFGNGGLQARSASYPVVLANAGNATVNIYGGDIIGRTAASGNGGTIEMHKNSGVEGVANNTLNIGGTAKIRNGKATAGSGGNIYCLYTDITIEGNAQVNSGQATRGGNIFQNYGTFSMEGGTIQSGNATSGAGGNLTLVNVTNATMTDGVIQAGVAETMGGNIEFNKSVGDFSGGTIAYAAVDNTQTASSSGAETGIGGQIVVNGDADTALTLSGVTVLGYPADNPKTVLGSATKNAREGGLVAVVEGATLNITDGRLGINEAGTCNVGTWGSASENGGNIYVNAANLNISGGIIAGGQATSSASATVGLGGNVHATGGAVVTVTGGTVQAGNGNRGGNFMVNSTATLTVGGGEGTATITGGTSATHGGNIYIGSRGVANVEDNALITAGEATTHASGMGGNLYSVGSGAIANINGGEISGGKVNQNGGNIAIQTGGQVVVTDGVISGGVVLEDNAETEDVVETKDQNVLVVNGVLTLKGGDLAHPVLAFGETAVIRLDGAFSDDLVPQIADNAKLQVASTFTGTAYINDKEQTIDKYGYGTVMNNVVAVALNAETGAYEASDVGYTGKVLWLEDQAIVGNANIVVTAATDTTGTVAVGDVQVRDKATGDLLTWQTGAQGVDYTQNYIKLAKATTLTLDGAAIVDVNGKAVTVNGEGALSLLDAQNNGFDASKCGKVTIDGEDVELDRDVTVGGKRYVTIDNDDGTVSAHCVGIELVSVALRTQGEVGYYYKAQYQFDDVIKDKIVSYGVAVSKNDMPGADFAEATTDINGWSEIDNAEKPLVSGAIVNGALLKNILVAGDANNAQNLLDEVYANPYLTIDNGDDVITMVGDDENAGKQAGICLSMLDVIKIIEGNWANMNGASKQLMYNFYDDWADVLAAHVAEIPNISKNEQ